jgi:hypothetical protein
MVAAGGDIDAIDFDNEDHFDSTVMVNFGITLANIGYSHVTFCPWNHQSVWVYTMKGLVAAKGSGFVSAIHLQCYDGGTGNVGLVSAWTKGFNAVGGKPLMIAGLATNQSSDGPWWSQNAQGASVTKVPNMAMSGSVNWDNYLYTQNFASVDDALQAAQTAASFFFYCRSSIVLANGRSFKAGDAVFFTGLPSWGSAPQCDAYYLGPPCSNLYNYPMGACPSDLQGQYKIWKGSSDGGFIWFYDSVISCLLASCCGGSMNAPAGTALAYRQAITNGLT